MIRRFLRCMKGYVMPYSAILIVLVGMPMMILSVELTRSMYVNVNIQTAVDAACAAAVQAVDVDHFISTGEVLVNSSWAASYAQREFDATVANSNVQNYSPSLTGVSVVNSSQVFCTASAQLNWLLPGVPAINIQVTSAAEAVARR